MNIIVKTLNGKLFNLEVQPNDSIKSIKRKIEQKEGVPIDEQHLEFGGTTLDDSKHLEDYDIKKEYTVDLVLNIKGG